MKLRNLCARIFVSLLMVFLVAGCASTSQQMPDSEKDQAEKDAPSATESNQETSTGPFEVALNWASELPTDAAPDAVGQLIGQWKIARVARVWAAGQEYRAVIVQKSTAGETPAVLLHIVKDDAGKWSVVGAKPTTSTHLWSEL